MFELFASLILSLFVSTTDLQSADSISTAQEPTISATSTTTTSTDPTVPGEGDPGYGGTGNWDDKN